MKIASCTLLSFFALVLALTKAASAALVEHEAGEARELRPGGRFPVDCSTAPDTMPEERTTEFRLWARCADIGTFDCDSVNLDESPPAREATLESVTFRRCKREAFRQEQQASLDCSGVVPGGEPPLRDGTGDFRTWVRCQEFDCSQVDLTQRPARGTDNRLERIQFRACRREARRNGTLP